MSRTGAPTEYGNALKDYRKRAGISQQELAVEMGFAYASHISRYESGEMKLSRSRFAEAIAAIERIVERRGQSDPLSALEVS